MFPPVAHVIPGHCQYAFVDGSLGHFLLKSETGFRELSTQRTYLIFGGKKDQINSPSEASRANNRPSSQALKRTFLSATSPSTVFQLHQCPKRS